MTIRWTTVSVVLGLTAIAAPVWAHHSMSKEYDLSRHVTVTGVITKLDWTNPHVWIYLGSGSPGQNDVWGIEAAPPHELRRKGIAVTSLSIGERIRVEGFPTLTPNS